MEHSKLLDMKNQCDITFHQLGDTLKDDLSDRIAKKTLTEAHLAVAPSVSFE